MNFSMAVDSRDKDVKRTNAIFLRCLPWDQVQGLTWSIECDEQGPGIYDMHGYTLITLEELPSGLQWGAMCMIPGMSTPIHAFNIE